MAVAGPAEQLVAEVVPLIPAWRVDREFSYLVPAELTGRVRAGSLVRMRFGGRRVRGVVTAARSEVPDRPLEPLTGVVVEVPVGPPLGLLAWIGRRYVASRGQVFAKLVPPRVRVKPPEPQAISGGPAPERISSYSGGAGLVRAIESGGAGTWCVRTLPGEDRGGLIAELVAAAGRGGGAALVAVPEVRYGASALDRLEAIWPHLARVDAARSDAERARAWLALGAGTGLGGGGRSVVLAPAPDLRLIVLDDEANPTYKEDRSPRYDARVVARERARLQAAACVFLSTTPSVELGYARRSGEVASVAPSRAADRSRRPVVEMVEPQSDRPVSHTLHQRVRDELRRGGRVGLLVPRAGFARAVWCAQCRRSLRCPVCEAGLLFDRNPRRVRCARCGHEADPPAECPACGAVEWRYLGAGSERLAEQVAAAFPRARVRRVDPASLAAGSGSDQDFEDSDIYVTTWIGTKPALRPPVSLVGVLDADALTRRPDFRAAERAYQAFVDMCEWAGPAEAGGRVVFQTAEPTHHALQAVARADYDFFLDRELPARRELAYPPFSELVKTSATGVDARDLIAEAARACRKGGARVVGPIQVGRPGPDGPVWQILAKCPDALEVAGRLRPLLAGARSGARLQVDVDPR